ncbi:MAG: DNA mismatch repair endonuclease MutL [Halobacteriales archaeon]
MIRKLDEETVELIAAGEVVENPASVVKELVENSLDAGASSVDIEVENGGIDRVAVADDGRGMDTENAKRAFERHATSKIQDADDVPEVDTLGFRGEALPSIARVARVEMVTKNDGVGATRVVTGVGVDEERVEETGRGRGTTVEVTRLFETTPARREALSSPKREFRRVSRLVTRYALAHPGVGFTLAHDGNEVLNTSGSGDPVDALYAVYGRDVASRATRFSYEDEHGRVAVEGALVKPSETRSNARHVYTSVNGRALDDETVRGATVDGYGTLLPKDRYPVAVVRVDVPPERVDVNVHPAKEKVRFVDEDAVRRVVSTAVRDALTNEDLTRRAEMELDAPVGIETSGDSAFADAKVIGQFRDLYLLCESGDDLLVVDQHAAHERVNYEELRAEFNGSVPSAELDEAVTVDLSPDEAAVVKERRDALHANGFRVEEFGGGLYRVRGVPAPMGRVGDTELVHDVLDRFVAGEEVDLRDEVLKDVACHPSLKAGDELNREEATELVRALGECEQPFACPHGRPTVLSVNERRIAEGFERGGVRL